VAALDTPNSSRKILLRRKRTGTRALPFVFAWGISPNMRSDTPVCVIGLDGAFVEPAELILFCARLLCHPDCRDWILTVY
jgi:hypothetical protein